MTSEERRQRRYERRVARREAKRAERDRALTLEAAVDMDALYAAAWRASKGVRWKASTQRYLKDVLRNIRRTRDEMLAGEDVRRGFHEFDLWERGKLRHISSVHFSERIPHKSINQNILVPAIAPSLVPGNTANRKGMGNLYAINLLRKQLRDHYRLHGTEGYILQFDFKGYFASIPHDEAQDLLATHVTDPAALAYAQAFVGDRDGRGLGLGSEPNQTVAVALPNRVDHYIIECCGVEAYARYMDDGYAIAMDKETLWAALSGVEWLACELGLEVNRKKTRVVKLTRGFTFLKKKFSYGEGGQVVVRPCRETITRERRKLKRLHALYERGEITREEVVRHYHSWRGGMAHINAHGATLRMDRLFKQLFGESDANNHGRETRADRG